MNSGADHSATNATTGPNRVPTPNTEARFHANSRHNSSRNLRERSPMATIEKYETKGGATLYAVRYRKPDNKQTWKRGFRTQRDAKAFAATVEVSKLRGEYIAPAVGKITVGALGPAGLARHQGPTKPTRLQASPVSSCV